MPTLEASIGKLLQAHGITFWPALRGENLMKYIKIIASDGYQVLFSLPEIDPEFTDKRVLLATHKNGTPLSEDEGPFRIIADEKKQPRSIRQITRIIVAYAD